MKVRATKEFKLKGVNPIELSFIPEENTEFEITEERYKILSGKNDFGVAFVEAIEEKAVPEKKQRRTTKK